MSKLKLGELNPMFNKPKSKAFIEQMFRDKTGANNPMFGKPKSSETLAKLSKKVYVYDGKTRELIKCYDSYKIAVKDLHVGHETIRKYLDTHKVYKEKLFYSEALK
jgi:group I intron endonuclease